ncbi:cell surface glycoprotein CD200 receptor 1-B-like [Trichomycterus rosablanca]|uniref:cell surface glycoprotein CD200 receptor 1-B-like n=1 Tax=Trichomycterus rosablanca TaxID=2290929 RepID=UPI002F350E2D
MKIQEHIIIICTLFLSVEGFKNESAEIGTNVTLHCTNRKIRLGKAIYTIWKINSHGKECKIGVSQNDPDHDTCSDGKKLIRSADGAYHLIIPQFSIHDEGTYTCDVSYKHTGYLETVYVSAWARPEVHGWLEAERSRTVAVCEATSRPASSIKWKTAVNFSSSSTEITETAEGLFTVASKINLPANVPHRNIICVASTSNPKFNQFHFNFMIRDSSVKSTLITLLVRACCIIALAFLIYILYKVFGVLKRIYRKPKEIDAPAVPDTHREELQLQSC